MTVQSTDPNEKVAQLLQLLAPDGFRFAAYDRKERVLYFGPSDVFTHMGVAEASGLLGNPPEYYSRGGYVVGGLVCRSSDGYVYFDPFSGTFPGTIEGVAEAEAVLAACCEIHEFPFQCYADVPVAARVDGSEV